MANRGGARLGRKIGGRDAKKRVVVVCEGLKTEPDYLRLINKRSRKALVELEIIDEPATSPKQLVERACQILSESKREARRTKDPNSKVNEIWCVFDVDEHPLLRESQKQASDNGISVAISNPCIEIWFLLHFSDQTANIHRDTARRSLEVHIPGYAKKFKDISSLEGRYEQAKKRALDLQSKHEGDETHFPDNNPSTDVWKLVDSLQAEY